jgi:hypothetical protein
MEDMSCIGLGFDLSRESIEVHNFAIHSSSKSNNFQLVRNDFKCYGSLKVDENGASLEC